MDIGSVATTQTTGTDTQRDAPTATTTQSTGTQTHTDAFQQDSSASTGSQTESMGQDAAMSQSTGSETESMGHTEAANASTGTETESMGFQQSSSASTGSDTQRQDVEAAMAHSTGQQTESMGNFNDTVSIDVGTQTESMEGSASGSATYPQGSQTESMGNQQHDATIATGTESESMAHTETAATPLGTQTESFAHEQMEVSVPMGSQTEGMGGIIAPEQDVVGSSRILDASGNAHHGVLSGTTPPTRVAANNATFGRELDWTGTSTNAGVNCGTAAALGIGTGAWTIELKFRATAVGIIRYLLSKWDSGDSANQNFFLRLSTGSAGNDQPVFSIKLADGTTHTVNGTGVEPTTGADHHLAIVYQPGSFMRMLYDGNQIGSGLPASAIRNPTAVAKFVIGAITGSGTGTLSQSYDERIDEVRVSDIVRYSGGTYTVPTAPFTTDANTVALWQMDEVPTTIVDSSGNGRDGVLEGIPPPSFVSAPTSGFAQALSFASAVESNENGEVAGVYCGTNWPNSLPNGFTVRGRFRYKATGALQAIAWRSGSPTANRQWKVYIDATGKMVFQWVNITPAEVLITGATTLTDGLTYEFECSVGDEASSNARIFLNGVQDAVSGATGRGTVADPGPMVIGKKSTTTNVPTPTSPFAGEIEEMEFANVQRHTAGYTPDGMPWAADANTLALYHFDNEGAAYDLSAEASTPVGTETASFAASGSAQLSDHTNTAASSGSPAWTNPTNAQGAINGTEAAVVVSNASASSTLTCTGLQLPATPSGWTRTGAILRIRHRWDLTISVPLTDDAQLQLVVRNSTGTTVLATPMTRTEDDAVPLTQATLITEEFSLNALSDTDLITNGIRVLAIFTASLSAIVGGNAGWNIDAIHLVGTYTRTGIT